jgi:putative hydrolase of the HAD superfamily
VEVDYKNKKVIGFDADDTLWVNETYFREAEEKAGKLLSHYETPNKIDQELFKMEIKNLPTYGYGVKGFMLSMIELAIELSNGTVSNEVISKMLTIGKDMIHEPIELLDGVEKVLKVLSKDYKLIVATKGDLLDQERKLEKSGLIDYFHHVEVLSEKENVNYSKLLKHLDIKPSEFLMIGNSLKSDILPLVSIGAQAIHVPFHTTWQHETVTKKETNGLEYKTVKSLSEILSFFEPIK